MTKKLSIVLGLVWLAFCGFGLLLHHACQDAPKNKLGFTDIAAYDSEGYVTHYTHPVGLLDVNHRHPLFAQITAPFTVLGLTVTYRAGVEVGRQAVLCCFALVGALTFLLLWLVLKGGGAAVSSRVAALALWMSFAHVWLLGGMAESFGVSQAILLGVLLLVVREVRDARAWFGMTFLAGGVTVTNAVKPLVAWMIAADGGRFLRRLGGRRIALGLAAGVGLLVAAAGCLAAKWLFVDDITLSSGIAITWEQIAEYLVGDITWSHRLWLVWNAFLCEPMMLHAGVICQNEVIQPYATPVPHLVGAAVLGLCAWSAYRNFRLPVVRAALAMVVFDVLLHAVVGWGLREGQLYCGHWFWIVPLLLGLLPGKAACLTAILAALIAANNLIIVIAEILA